MNAVAVPEATTTSLAPEQVLGRGGKKGGGNARTKKAPARIASRVDDDDDSACDERHPSTSYPPDPTLETCCHDPPPIALHPLNEFLFWGEKYLKLPIPPTNDIVLIQRTVLQELGFPDANADTLAKRFRDARMPNRAAWFSRFRPLSWKLYSLASELALPGMFRYLDARVRFFDGVVEEALRGGVDQHLFLAAGYDTRAVRMATSEAASELAASRRRGAEGGRGKFGDSARALLSGGSAEKNNDDDLDERSPSSSSRSSARASTSSSEFAPRFFEVDLPRVSAAKRELVEQVLPDASRWPRPSFVGADLLDARGTLEALARAGFDASASRPCLATLEGILMYLPPNNARSILRTVSTLLTPGSLLAFDFVVEECFATGGLGRTDGGASSSSSYLSDLKAKLFPAYPTYGLVASSVAHHGEPFRSGFDHDPVAHAALAASLGFKVRQLLDAPKVVETFFSGKKCRGPVSDYMAMALWEKL